MSLNILKNSSEIDEGFLICSNCKTEFPIIQKIPIIMEDFVTYIGSRRSLGGRLHHLANTTMMKQFIKNSLSKIKKTHIDDYSLAEERWSEIYISNRDSSFYSALKNKLSDFPSCDNVLEFGSSVGIVSSFLRKRHRNVLCVDTSFTATLYAKKKSFENLDFFVSDALNHPFGKKKFDLILALNLLEIVEPTEILETISKQIKDGYIILTDPYDYTRGKNSVKSPLYSKEVRKKLRSIGFVITKKTNQPSYINWTLKINPRTKLVYKVDVVIRKK